MISIILFNAHIVDCKGRREGEGEGYIEMMAALHRVKAHLRRHLPVSVQRGGEGERISRLRGKGN